MSHAPDGDAKLSSTPGPNDRERSALKSPYPEEIGKLVERLNDAVRYSYLPHGLRGDLEQAASALTALVEERDELDRAWLNAEAKISELRAALKPFATFPVADFWTDDSLALTSGQSKLLAGDFRRARQALKEADQC